MEILSIAFLIWALWKTLYYLIYGRKEEKKILEDMVKIDELKSREFHSRVHNEWVTYHDGDNRTFGEFGEFFTMKQEGERLKKKAEYIEKEYFYRHN